MDLENCNLGNCGEEVVNGWNWRNKDKLTYQQYVTSKFKVITELILLKFNERNNYELMNSLQKYIEEKLKKTPTKTKEGRQPSSTIFNDADCSTNLANAFGELYGGRRYTLYDPNPGKYLSKLNPKEVSSHPFLEYLKFDKKELYSNLDTLDGNRRRGKNTVIREMEQSAKSAMYGDGRAMEDGFYEKVPFIVFERNYLEIVKEIWEERVRQLLRI
jgi:hypothetical protein